MLRMSPVKCPLAEVVLYYRSFSHLQPGQVVLEASTLALALQKKCNR
jgi:hypothetical protein